MKQQLLDLLRREDLSSDMQRLADSVGLDVVRKVIGQFYGERLDIPGPRTLRKLRERYIESHYAVADDGSDNRRALAKEMGVSLRFVEQYLHALPPRIMR